MDQEWNGTGSTLELDNIQIFLGSGKVIFKTFPLNAKGRSSRLHCKFW